VRTPSQLSPIEAAALPCAGITAYQALVEKLNVKPGQTILVQGGAGGVGGYAIQIAVKLGLEVITTASSRNSEWVKILGATGSVDYGNESTRERIAEITNGNGVEAILDTVGRETSTEGLAMLTFSGGLACVATLPDLETYRQSGQALSLHNINLGGAYRHGNQKAMDQLGSTSRQFAEFINSKGIASGTKPPGPLASSLTTVLCTSIALLAYVTRGKSGVVLAIAAFLLLVMEVDQASSYLLQRFAAWGPASFPGRAASKPP
jgi:NADPH:quinone reductase-like Zn-dependent oxidoreductase